MKRRTEIAEELAKLRQASHPGEYYSEIYSVAVRSAVTPKIVHDLLQALYEAQPEIFEVALQRLSGAGDGRLKFSDDDDALMLAAFLADQRRSRVGKTAWVRTQIDPDDDRDDRRFDALLQRLKRTHKRYQNDGDFRARADRLCEQVIALASGGGEIFTAGDVKFTLHTAEPGTTVRRRGT